MCLGACFALRFGDEEDFDTRAIRELDRHAVRCRSRLILAVFGNGLDADVRRVVHAPEVIADTDRDSLFDHCWVDHDSTSPFLLRLRAAVKRRMSDFMLVMFSWVAFRQLHAQSSGQA